MAFRKVEVIANCPTTVSKLAGLYFRAETIKFSINNQQYTQITDSLRPGCKNSKLSAYSQILHPFLWIFSPERIPAAIIGTAGVFNFITIKGCTSA